MPEDKLAVRVFNRQVGSVGTLLLYYFVLIGDGY